MRALLRTRKQLVRKQASHVQRIQKTLEDANLKLGSMLTQIMGVSGRESTLKWTVTLTLFGRRFGCCAASRASVT
jgi:hypothetical protein